jgi:hypothetical protein
MGDEVRGISKFFYPLGFPLGAIGVLGSFSVAFAIAQDQISLDNRRFVFGALLISVTGFGHFLPKIYRASFYDAGVEKWRKHFSLGALVWTGAFGFGAFYLGRVFFRLIGIFTT